ncbi:MAG: cellulase family glycosylhydrolase [Acidimicrobiales bacterium]
MRGCAEAIVGRSPIPPRRARTTVAALLLTGGLLAGGLLTACGPPGNPESLSTQYSSPAQIRSEGNGQHTVLASDGVVSGALRAPGGPYLYDRWGRIVTLHGVDAVYKHRPFELYPDPGRPWDFTATDARRIADLGFDVVRLGILWQGLEPGTGGPNDPATCTVGAPGHDSLFDQATVARYLAHVTRTVDLLGRYHIYTLLDMHQDVYNQAFRGEGAPGWAVCTDGRPIVPLGGRWSRNYSSGTLITAETHFWLNNVVGNLQGQFDQAWAMVAHHFAENPWVVGYDPYNEPYSPGLSTSGAQTFAVDLECFYTGRAHPGTLDTGSTPIVCPPDDPAEGVVPRIEAADPHHLVFIEPDNFSVRHHLPSLLGRMAFPRLVYNFHAYCIFRDPDTGDPTDVDACSNEVLRNISTRQRERSAMSTRKQPGGPAWFMSEFGATDSVALLDQVTGLANDVELGWAYWAWKFYDDPTGSSHEGLVAADGRLKATAKVLSRPYAQAIAGTPVSTLFDIDDDRFQLVYAPSPDVAAPTVIFVDGAMQYPHGYCTSVVGGQVTSPAGATHVLVQPDQGATRVSVTIAGGPC